jgi:hypothetical protein
MTEPRARRRAYSQRPAYVVYAGAAAAFAGVLAGLAWQVASGADPAIGEGEPAAAPPERVIVRRIVVARDGPARPHAPAPAAAAAAPAPEPAPATTRAS